MHNAQTSLGSRPRLVLVALALATTAVLCWQFLLPAGQTPRHQFEPGRRLTYRLAYFGASAADFGVLTRGISAAKDSGEIDASKVTPTLITNLTANLEATVVAVDADGAAVMFAFRDADLQVLWSGELALSQTESLQADLRRIMIANVDRDGRIRSVQLDPQVSSIGNTLLRTLVASTQVVFGEEGAEPSTDVVEGDPNGEYIARYKLVGLESADIATFTKEKVSYSPPKRQAALRKLNLDRVVQSSGKQTMRFDTAAGHLVSIQGNEITTILVDSRIVARTETRLDLQLRDSTKLSSADMEQLGREFAALQGLPAISISAPTLMAEREASLHRNELGEVTADSLLRDLERLDAPGESGVAETPLYLKLKALIYLHPESCPRLATILATARTDSHALQLVTDALSSIGHAAAQAALTTAIQARRNDETALAALVPAVAMVEMPTPASEEALRQLAADSPFANIRASAELGLGTMAHELAAAQPLRADHIVRAMADQLAGATSSESRRQYLFVLGNAGLKQSLPAIERHLADPSAEVRAAAMAALRWIDVAAVDSLLCEALAKDADSQVRVEAATALGFRALTKTSFAAQTIAYFRDSSVSVRLALMANLARAAASFPEGRQLLQQALQDPCQEIRDQADALLAAQDGPQHGQ